MKIKLSIFLLLLLLSSCFENQNEYMRYANRVTNEVINILIQRHNLEAIQFGGGSMRECIQDLSLTFEIERPKTKEELRRIMVDSLETFLNVINNDKQVRPYLITYPFTLRQIHLTIYVRDKDKNYALYPEINSVSLFKKGITYETCDQECNLTEFVETYEEAKKIIKSENKHPNNIK